MVSTSIEMVAEQDGDHKQSGAQIFFKKCLLWINKSLKKNGFIHMPKSKTNNEPKLKMVQLSEKAYFDSIGKEYKIVKNEWVTLNPT